MSEKQGLKRREFLRNAAVGALGAGLLGSGKLLTGQEDPKNDISPEWKIKEYRMLGRTNFKVSDVSTGYVKNTAVLEKLLDAGVNYIDTAEVYGNEPEVGQVISKRDRSKIFVTSKLVIDPKKNDLTKAGFLKRFDGCLKRLQTDYIDCMMMHSVEDFETLKTPGFYAAMEQMKKQGKLRHIGISNHGTNNTKQPDISMKDILIAAANDGRFDVMLLAYNFIQEDNGAEVLKYLKKKNIGATLMKVNPTGSLPRIKAYVERSKKEKKEIDPDYIKMIPRLEAKQKKAQPFIEKYGLDDDARLRAAAIKFVLSNPDMHTVCCGFRSFDDLDVFLPLSGTRLSGLEKQKLAAYKEGCGDLYCRHACGICESSCPQQVQVNNIMRFNHYYTAQGKEKYAMAHYNRIEKKADVCSTCSGHCESACPYGVPVQGMLAMAHETLTLA